MKIVDFVPKDKNSLNWKEIEEGFTQISKMSKIYYDNLIQEGFTSQQALQIVSTHKWF